MLYDRWLQTARQNRRELALVSVPEGKRWTFAQLEQIVEQAQPPAGKVVFPTGAGSDFILAVLSAWKAGVTICPLDQGQTPVASETVPERAVHLKTTSATTGVPRLIAFSAEQLVADVDQIVATMGLRAEWPNLGVISLAHSYGFSNLVLPLLLHGIPLVLSNSPLPETLRRTARLAPSVTLPAVPALWRAWLDTGAIPQNIKLAISAGAPLPLPLEIEIFDRCGLKIHNFYGASECGGIAYDTSLRPRTDASCIGAPLKGVELTVQDDGCLRVCSRAVGMTYLPDASPNLRDSCYQSTDLASIEGGLVFLRGRQSDLINVAGRKVFPEKIEGALAAHPDVVDCLVFGIPSSELDRTEIIVACVAARSAVSQQALREHLLATLPPWQIPREWWFIPRFDTNTRGKIARGAWRRKYLEGKNSANSPQ